ncbi:MAG: hypothetical protein CfClM3_1121 [Methanobrevibacter sp. CfCl-M3]
MINKKIFSLILLGLISLGCVSAGLFNNNFGLGNTNTYKLNAIVTDGVTTQSIGNVEYNIINIDFSKANALQDFFVTLENTQYADAPKEDQIIILNCVKNSLEGTGNFTAEVKTDSKQKPYLVATGQKACKINRDFDDGTYVITGGTSATKTYLKFRVTGEVTPIQSELKLNGGFDSNHFTSNQFSGSLIAKDFVLGEKYIKETPIGQSVSINIKNLDFFQDPVDNTIQVASGGSNVANTFNFNFRDVPKIRDGRPGQYVVSASFNGNGVYTDAIANSLNGSSPNTLKINNIGHSDTIYGTTNPIGTTLQYKVTDYFGDEKSNVDVEFSSGQDKKTAKTGNDGVVSFTYSQSFGVDDKLDYNRSFTITPINLGLNSGRGSTDSISFHRQADTGKSVCLQTMGKGLVWDTKTFNAPNGMSISAKGGIFGCIGLYKITWYDKDKKLIKTEEWDNFKSGDKDERFYVPAGAEYVKYKVGCKSSGKDKPETDYLPAGNAIIFYEGAANTENVHIAAQNANGYEILREDYNC